MDKKTDRLIHLIKQAQEKHADDFLILLVPGFISKKFIAHAAMKEDLELALQYIKEMRTKPAGVLKSALTYALVGLYAKCFTDASKSSFPKLEPTDVFKDEKGHQEFHDYIMEIRHQFLSHRGDTEHEVGIAYMLIPKTGEIDKTAVRFNQLKMVGLSDEDLNKFEGLLNFLFEKLMAKIQKNAEKIQQGMTSIFTPEQMSFMLMNNAK